MPSVNRIMASYNSILFSLRSLDLVHNYLMHETENFGDEYVPFKSEIVLENINFEYEEGKPVLKDINLTIKKGSKIAFIGESGSGKSTLVDLMIGLHKPKTGLIKSDNNLLSS